MKIDSTYKQAFLYLVLLLVIFVVAISCLPTDYYTNGSSYTSGFYLIYTLLVGIVCSIVGILFGKLVSLLDGKESSEIILGSIPVVVLGIVMIVLPVIMVETGFEIKFGAGAGLKYDESVGTALLTAFITSIAYNIPSSD